MASATLCGGMKFTVYVGMLSSEKNIAVCSILPV